jgi:hypothetical protein
MCDMLKNLGARGTLSFGFPIRFNDRPARVLR